MAQPQLAPGESLIKELTANHIVKNWAFPVIGLTFKSGRLFLTSQRIVFHRRPTLLFFLAGFLAYSSSGKFALDIPLSLVKEISRRRAGLLGPALCVTTHDGNEHVFVVRSSQFIDGLQEAVATHLGSRLALDGDSHWVVQKV
jgi:hypothetical protein